LEIKAAFRFTAAFVLVVKLQNVAACGEYPSAWIFLSKV
jgi:hypothetical protein